MSGLDCLGATEIVKPLAGRAGMYGEVYGCGIRDGRGYGPYGAGYTNVDGGLPYGPNGEILSAEYDFQPPLERMSIKWRPPRKVLPGFGTTEIGIEGTDIAKMFGNILSGTGGVMSSATGGKKADDSQAAAERKRLEEEKRKAEQSASTMKTALVVGGVAVAAIGGGFLLKSRKQK